MKPATLWVGMIVIFVCGYLSSLLMNASSNGGSVLPSANLADSFSYSRDAKQQCQPKTEHEVKMLKKEITEYEASSKFSDKIKEAKGEAEVAAHHVAIMQFLKEYVLEDNMSILELGCAAASILRMTRDVYKDMNRPHGDLVGVELVTGWVKWAQGYFTDLKIFEGDITEFDLPDLYQVKTFDLIMLNDVLEHIQPNRYGCFFDNLKRYSHPGTVVYFHTPTPEAQIFDKDQFYENVVPHDLAVRGMATAGFELVKFEHDLVTKCGGEGKNLPKALRGAGCHFGHWVKYTHMLFQKAHDHRVFTLG
jgi:SAM-dependent methyltransferase